MEIKSSLRFGVPGYIVYLNPSKVNDKRGGVALLVKASLLDYMYNIDMSVEDQIWFQLRYYPEYVFGGVYIPPEDSLYFDQALFGSLNAKMGNFSKAIIMGDFNARVSKPNLLDAEGVQYTYRGIKDFVLNNNGKQLIDLCSNCDCVVANHLAVNDKQFGGNLSYRKGPDWISELDLCLLKGNSLTVLQSVEIDHDVQGSDHAPLSVALKFNTLRDIATSVTLDRASNLGKSFVFSGEKSIITRGPSCQSVNLESFSIAMSTYAPPNFDGAETRDVSRILNDCSDLINSIAKSNVYQCPQYEWDQRHPRWKRLLNQDDSKVIWRAIDWKGNVSDWDDERPDDNQFKTHFEELLNPNVSLDEESFDAIGAPYIPILDDPFTTRELEDVVSNLKKNKSFIGICPGVFAVLPILWKLFFLTIFNFVFLCTCYPFTWCSNKLITLFKKGNKLDCNNYRGISIMNTLAKIYDMLLMNRLSRWCSIDKCQAGAQRGRGCIEQIMALRLLIDFVKYKKRKLYVLFVDYSKAYDKVPRRKMLSYLKSLGCGKIMLLAIQSMYKTTKNILKSATVESSIGVRQGAPTSCLLFVIYMDKMIKMMKERIGTDGFLRGLHALLLMDDTVIVATSRSMCERKFKILLDYCTEYGMVVNSSKTKFFVVNADENDKEPFMFNNILVEYCAQYLYLGAWFVDDAKIKSVLKLHTKSSCSLVNKFAIFCAANTTMPFSYKMKVFQAAVMSALLYSSESWLTSSVPEIERTYNKLVRLLLCVRNNTPIPLCLIELGLNTVQYEIDKRRRGFLKANLNVNLEEPFHFVFDMCKSNNTPGYRFLVKCLEDRNSGQSFENIQSQIREKPLTATKYVTYRTKLNKELSLHSVYKGELYITDYKRQAFSRMRLMSHSLKIELGRWNRIPRELRLCICTDNYVQDEEHVLLSCSLTSHIRMKYLNLNYTDIVSLLNEGNPVDICNYVYEIVEYYKN